MVPKNRNIDGRSSFAMQMTKPDLKPVIAKTIWALMCFPKKLTSVCEWDQRLFMTAQFLSELFRPRCLFRLRAFELQNYFFRQSNTIPVGRWSIIGKKQSASASGQSGGGGGRPAESRHRQSHASSLASWSVALQPPEPSNHTVRCPFF